MSSDLASAFQTWPESPYGTNQTRYTYNITELKSITVWIPLMLNKQKEEKKRTTSQPAKHSLHQLRKRRHILARSAVSPHQKKKEN
jgi:hypothetical protein